ncbi:MAG TPA: alpha/beta fold hydrolase [Novosphingobium sp.]|nr:alpha/beta fold hydrolase [Novosphingobium sp.]
MTDQITEFRFVASDAALGDLRTRLALTRWPEAETVEDWSQGVPLSVLRELVDYWRDGYDWRRCEARLHALPQFTTKIDGLDIHFIHLRSRHENARPLLLTHGWPGSVLEFVDAIPRLVDPEAHGGTAADAFHVVVPSLPGYGFSGKPEKAGWNLHRTANAWAELMKRLGYERWFAQGGDWGSALTCIIGALAPPGCAGVHVNLMGIKPPEESLANPTPEEAHALACSKFYYDSDNGYATEQSTRPQTIGYSLVDSPVGLAAWILEKIYFWTDNNGSPFDAISRDKALDEITLYWLTASGASSARMYWESLNWTRKREPIIVPLGYTLFPREIFPTPVEWVRAACPTLVYGNKAARGGHFAAWEQPEIFVDELRAAFAAMDN